MQGNMLEEARRPARSRRAAMGEALRKALDMQYLHAGEYVDSTVQCANSSVQANAHATYCAGSMSRAALSQVRFRVGTHSCKTV